jgi:hypothetical protein
LSAAAVLTKSVFTLADRLRIQQERSRDKQYIPIGRLTAVVFEGPRDIRGLSQAHAEQSDFSRKQTLLWCSITLDWLTHKNAPVLAVSSDRQDLLLPLGMTPLPDLPDPRWRPKYAGDIAPRIPQLLTGCPVVGDRVRDKITDRKGRVYGVIHPITELSVMCGQGFLRIRGQVDPVDGTHPALLIDDSNPEKLRGYFVGGKFEGV